MRSFATTMSLFTLLSAAGCGAVDTTAEDVEPISLDDSKADVPATLPKPADAQARLYFDTPNVVTLNDDNNYDYRVFDARGRHEFKLIAVGLDDAGNQDATKNPGMKLYRLGKSHGRAVWQLVAQSPRSSDPGTATIYFTGATSATYMAEFVVDPHPSMVKEVLECGGGDHAVCALGGQPGDSCRSNRGCEGDQQACGFPAGTCGSVAGACYIVRGICPLFYAPVCGCDHHTYSNGCAVAAARQSILHDGACN